MAKHTPTICVFDHFVRLAPKGLIYLKIAKPSKHADSHNFHVIDKSFFLTKHI